MSEPTPRDAWHEDLLATLRARAEKSRRQAGPTPTADVPTYNWPEVSSRLSRAAAVAVADSAISVGRQHTGLRRALIVRLRGLMVSLLRFLTSRQSEYNLGVLYALRETGGAVRSLEQRLAVHEKEIGQLRERITHLEAHLPAERTRKAS
jgi:hypothetical protein